MGFFSKKTQYQKDCEKRIDELCGGFFYNDAFKNRAALYKDTTVLSNDNEKSILKHECESGNLMIDDIETRLDELLQLDCRALELTIRTLKKQDTSRFKTQRDIEDFLGPEYVMEYNHKRQEINAKKDIKRVGVSSKYDLLLGVNVEVIFPSVGLKIDNVFVDVFNEQAFKTEMVVDSNQVTFRNSLKDLSDLNIPFTIIFSADRVDSDYLGINLIENQQIQIKFLIDEIWSYGEVKQLLQENFLRLMNACHDGDSEDRNKCPECGAFFDENDKFCPVCGRNL